MKVLASVIAKLPIQKGKTIVAKIKDITKWARLEMAKIQQDQELQANCSRNVAPVYQVGNKVYLSLQNIQTDGPNKKLDNWSAKFTVTEVVSPSAYRLDILPGIYNIFNMDLLQPAAADLLPSQALDDLQLPAVLIDDKQEWQVERILQK